MTTLFLLLALLAGRTEFEAAGREAACISAPPLGREIRAAPIPIRGALAVDPSRLPAGMRGKLPSFDGDSFAVTLVPPRSVETRPPREVFEDVVVPLLTAMGLHTRAASMRIPGAGYMYQQLESGVPIETAVVIVTPNSVSGTLFGRYRVVNGVRLADEAAASAVSRDLAWSGRADLVLLPYGGTPDGNIALRYAYRMLLAARDDAARTWLGWIDADSGCVLQLTPQFEKE